MSGLRKGQSRKLTKRERELIAPDLQAFAQAQAHYAEALGRLSRIISALEPAPDVQFNPETLEVSRPAATPTGPRPPRKRKGRK